MVQCDSTLIKGRCRPRRLPGLLEWPFTLWCAASPAKDYSNAAHWEGCGIHRIYYFLAWHMETTLCQYVNVCALYYIEAEVDVTLKMRDCILSQLASPPRGVFAFLCVRVCVVTKASKRGDRVSWVSSALKRSGPRLRVCRNKQFRCTN